MSKDDGRSVLTDDIFDRFRYANTDEISSCVTMSGRQKVDTPLHIGGGTLAPQILDLEPGDTPLHIYVLANILESVKVWK